MLLIVFSIIIQFFAAFYAIRLTKKTGKIYAWLFISLALFLMGIRRIIPLYHLVMQPDFTIDYPMEVIGLVLSVSMLIGVIGIGKIFIERKSNQQRIQALLEEKEILLREVHHRIKNNMVTVGSLLRLQSEYIQNDSAKSALRDAQNRIESMLLLYDKIYRTASFHDISTTEYLSSLIDEIVHTTTTKTRIRIVKDIENFKIGVREMYYIGIILNEIITNCLKHAFIQQESGLIHISINKRTDQAFFSVKDNGIGMTDAQHTEDFHGFGMLLIQSLIEQLHGTLHVAHDNGTTINFSVGLDDTAGGYNG